MDDIKGAKLHLLTFAEGKPPVKSIIDQADAMDSAITTYFNAAAQSSQQTHALKQLVAVTVGAVDSETTGIIRSITEKYRAPKQG